MARPSINAFVPARIGSTRLPRKNLALLDGQPLMAYAIRAARDAGVFDRVIVNGDHPAFGDVARRYGAEFHLRAPALGSSQTRSDDVVLDFLEHFPCDVVAWVNTTNPLQSAEELRGAVDDFFTRDLDSLITVERRQVHCRHAGRPVNYEPDAKFARTQDLEPVEAFVYSLMLWRSDVFRAAMQQRGHGLFCGRFGTYPVSREAAIVVKTEEDLRFAERLLRSGRRAPAPLRYDACSTTTAAPR